MSYSVKNPAWGKMRQGQHDHRIAQEVELAAAILRACPSLTRSDALRQAARICDR